MTSRELVRHAVTFKGISRLPYDLSPEYGSDFYFAAMQPSPDDRPRNGKDEWGAVWENIGVSKLGEVKTPPLKSWDAFSQLPIPDVDLPARWEPLRDARQKAGDKFLFCPGISIYERVHFIRGLENTWMDIYQNREQLCRLIDILVEMNLAAIRRYAAAGADGFYFCDDWGLQNTLMIAPDIWRQIWKPRYARIWKAAHDAGLLTFLHSCGYIVDILDDMIEAGLDVIQMDQQENMGLELLSQRFRGRITFWCPVDIQATMVHGSLDEIRAYCHRMVRLLGTPKGGFIAKWYNDPDGAGHRPEAILAMCEEFLAISKNIVQEYDSN